MRKVGVGIALVLALVLSAAPALAVGPYVGAQAGAVFLNDADITDPIGPAGEISFDTGWGAGLVGGFSFDMFRLEGELFYKSNDVDQFTVLGLTFPGDGDVTAWGVMVNAYFDFKTGTAFTPYIGAGVGYAQVSANDVGEQGFPADVDDDDAVFAYQGIAGLGFAISPNLTLDLMYKYFATQDPEFDVVGGGTIETEYSSHNVMLGLRFNF